MWYENGTPKFAGWFVNGQQQSGAFRWRVNGVMMPDDVTEVYVKWYDAGRTQSDKFVRLIGKHGETERQSAKDAYRQFDDKYNELLRDGIDHRLRHFQEVKGIVDGFKDVMDAAGISLE
jgi:hypothetical protein